MLEMLTLKKKRIAKIRIRFYMNYNLTKNVTKVKKTLNVACFSYIQFIILQLQKQSAAGVFAKKFSANMRQIYRKTHTQKCHFNKDVLQIY